MATVAMAQTKASPAAPATGAHRGAGGMHGPMMDGPGSIENLLDSMDLSTTQRQAIDAKLADLRTQNKAKMEAARPTDAQMTQIKDLHTQIQQARKSGDKTKVASLETQLSQLTAPQREAHKQMQQQVHDAIKAQLNADQVDQFEKLWTQHTSRGFQGPMGRGMGGAGNPRMLHRAVMSLGLSADQQTKVNQIFQDFRTAQQQNTAKTPADHKAAATDLRTKINAVLTDDQKTQLDQKLANGPGMHRGGRRGHGNGAPSNGAGGASDAGEAEPQ